MVAPELLVVASELLMVASELLVVAPEQLHEEVEAGCVALLLARLLREAQHLLSHLPMKRMRTRRQIKTWMRTRMRMTQRRKM